MLKSLGGFIRGMFTSVGGIFMFVIMSAIPIGDLYWLWMAIQIGSFWMFVLGLVPPLFVIAAPIGIYSLIFGPPAWIFSFFG